MKLLQNGIANGPASDHLDPLLAFLVTHLLAVAIVVTAALPGLSVMNSASRIRANEVLRSGIMTLDYDGFAAEIAFLVFGLLRSFLWLHDDEALGAERAAF